MITKEMFINKCSILYPEYDFSTIEWISYTTPIKVICKKHGEFTILPNKLYQQRGRCKQCRHDIISYKSTINAKERLQKAKQTCKEKYGVENPYQSEEVKEKIATIQNERYGGIGTSSKIISEKIAKTKEEKYGDPYYTNREKCWNTIRNNGWFSKHTSENACYELLLLKYPNAKHNYKSEKYPYKCDFYIPEKDLYIELNGFYMHGGHWFDKNNHSDVALVEKWKQMNSKQSLYAIQIWTKKDLEKKKCAEDNKLNYLVFWSKEEFITWLNSI